MLDRTRLQSVTARYPYLQGLLLVPIGLWIMLSSSLPSWWPWRNELLLWPAFVLAAWAYLRINRSYQNSFGRVVISRSQRLRDGAWAVAALLVLAGALFLDTRYEFPVSTFGATFAALMLVYWKYAVGLRPRHLPLASGLFLSSLAPLWTGVGADSAIVIIGLAQGAALVVAGLLDHADLVSSMASSQGLSNAASQGRSSAGF